MSFLLWKIQINQGIRIRLYITRPDSFRTSHVRIKSNIVPSVTFELWEVLIDFFLISTVHVQLKKILSRLKLS